MNINENNQESENNNKNEHYMLLALEQAEKALNNGEVPVGCVFVYYSNDNEVKVIGAGFNQTNQSRNGTRHAEMVAIDRILLENQFNYDIFRSCDLYVTCEPCIMCAAALSKIGIRCVYFGCHNDRFGGNGSIMNLHQECPRSSPYRIVTNLLQEKSILLFQQFYSGINIRAPVEKRKRRRIKGEGEQGNEAEADVEDESENGNEEKKEIKKSIH